jgi:hypothetical protein
LWCFYSNYLSIWSFSYLLRILSYYLIFLFSMYSLLISSYSTLFLSMYRSLDCKWGTKLGLVCDLFLDNSFWSIYILGTAMFLILRKDGRLTLDEDSLVFISGSYNSPLVSWNDHWKEVLLFTVFSSVISLILYKSLEMFWESKLIWWTVDYALGGFYFSMI